MAVDLRSSRGFIEPPRPVLPETVAFLGSFLLFTLEFMAAKALLPAFGGAGYVWTGSLMFFQGALLLGTLYCGWVLGRLSAPAYARAHLLMLLAPALLFPIEFSAPAPAAGPMAGLLMTLAGSIGPVFLILSMTTPVIQSWARLRPGEDDRSYSIYGASNAGALTALVSYPFIIEPHLALSRQLDLWQGAYFLYAALHLFCLPRRANAAPETSAPPAPREKLIWFLLALGPSASLLAATNLIQLDFSAVPFIWMAPLAAYLATFILNFKRRPWYPRRLSLMFVAALLAWLVLVMATVLYSPDIAAQWQSVRRLWVVNKFVFVVAALFIVGMICHRALAQSKPPAERSPQFYIWIAAGGWAGSALIALLMPWLGRRTAMPEMDWALAGGLSIGALLLKDWGRLRGLGGESFESRLSYAAWILGVAAVLGALGFGFYLNRSAAFSGTTVFAARNFYGYYRVVDDEGFRKFYHGNTIHGMEYINGERRGEPLLYYHRRSPLGHVFGAFGASLRRIGAVGLGVGAAAAYGRPGQSMDFYELDPAVEGIARDYFTFLGKDRVEAKVIAGDARLSLRDRPGRRYDMILLDAFNGGAIPIHLMTREALELYRERLSEGGLLVIHITNRFLNLRPVLAALARDMGLSAAARGVRPGEFIPDEMHFSSWAVLSADAAKIRRLVGSGWDDLGSLGTGVKPWTDGHASLWPALGP